MNNFTFVKKLNLKRGQVIKTTGSWFTVRPDTMENDQILCKIKGNYRIKGIKATNPVAVGDWVSYLEQNDGTGLINHIEERKNYLIRRSSNLSKQYQLIASNIDQAWLIVSLVDPRTLPEFIDRFLVTTEAYSIPAKIVFNKTDLLNEDLREELEIMKYMYESVGYPCYSSSAKEKTGLEELKNNMKDRLNVFSGNSGVGKSTIINALDSKLNLKTEEISSAHRTGKHTTTFAEMFPLSFGGFIIDTPGIRGFGLIEFDREELFHFFPEIFKASHNCKFHNCLHLNEPDCGVIKAVENGEIFESRYISYLNMLEGDDKAYR